MKRVNQTVPFLILMIVFILVSFASFGCVNQQKGSVQPKNKPATQSGKNPFYVSIAAKNSPKETFNQYAKLLQYISEKLDRPVNLIQRKTYQEINDLLKDKRVDLAFVGTGGYIAANRDFGAELLAVPLINNEPVFYSYVIVRKDSKINDFAEFSNRTFAFSDPFSCTGKLYPTYLLATQGTTPGVYFAQFIFTYNHDNCIKAVADNVVDGAAVDSVTFNYMSKRYPQMMKEIKVVLTSPPFAIPPVIVRKDLDPNIKAQLREIFLNIHKNKEGMDVIRKLMIDKFVEGNDEMYDSVREMEAAVGGK